jgi:endonuclease III related protein
MYPMTLGELYEALRTRFGTRADPGARWPVFFGRTEPPAFERVISNVLVQSGSWPPVPQAVAALDRAGLLTATALARAPEEAIAECVRPTGLQAQKARRLKDLAAFVLERFGTEAAFCAGVTRGELLSIPGIGEETVGRTLLYTCGRLAWPVDTYCLRVLAHHGILPEVPTTPAAKRHAAAEVRRLVEGQIPRRLDDWQRLHAILQLHGETLRKTRSE